MLSPSTRGLFLIPLSSLPPHHFPWSGQLSAIYEKPSFCCRKRIKREPNRAMRDPASGQTTVNNKHDTSQVSLVLGVQA